MGDHSKLEEINGDKKWYECLIIPRNSKILVLWNAFINLYCIITSIYYAKISVFIEYEDTRF